MNDQTSDPTDQPPGDAGSALTRPDHDVVKAQVDNILDLDTILSSARLVERTTRICVDGQLEQAYNETLLELAPLVEADGTPLDEDLAIGEQSRAVELQAKAKAQRAEMDTKMLVVRWRAMPSDEWEAFDKAHTTNSGQRKDSRKFENELMAACAVAPVITVDDVENKLRKRLNQAQFVTLFNDAYFVNAKDGVDIPKSPSYLNAPRPQE